LRQEVLEDLGWRLHRIWSTDWYRDPEQELDRALIAIQKAGHDYRNKSEIVLPKTSPNIDVVSIEREEVVLQHKTSIPYERANLRIRLGRRDLHEVPSHQLLPFICQVVEIESPIHQTELTHRITESAGLKRAGRRIQMTVQNAINSGVRQTKLCQKGDFIWHPNMKEPQVRDRSGLDAASKKFELVSPEEIRLAIFQEVERGFSLSQDDSIANAARSLGFQRVTAQAKDQFGVQLDKLVLEGMLVSRNGLVSVHGQSTDSDRASTSFTRLSNEGFLWPVSK